MPEPYWPKSRGFPVSRLNEVGRQLVRVRCTYCKREHCYLPGDLIEIFGDVEVDSLRRRMKCEGCSTGNLDVRSFLPTGSEAVGLKIRRLVAIKIRHVPVWKEE